jgi:hypothetical protein
MVSKQGTRNPTIEVIKKMSGFSLRVEVNVGAMIKMIEREGV